MVRNIFYPPTQKTTGLPVDECENGNPFASADVRPFLEKADRYSAKLPNRNFGAKQHHLEGTTPACRTGRALAVGLHRSMKINSNNIRNILRWTHIILGLIILCYIYSPFHEKRAFQIIVKFLVIPVITFSGLWLWKFKAFNKFFRIE